jgi:hypothetical protein
VALLLLLPGSVILPLVGWIAGVVLLCVSNVWTTRDKLIGVLLPPGGLFAALYVGLIAGSVEGCSGQPGGQQTCTGDGSSHVLGVILFVVLLGLPFVTAGYLAWRVKQSRAR